jgi:poly(A) polymerase
MKILSHPKPSIGFWVLERTGVLGVVFPELAALVGVEQRDEYHHKDVFDHTLKVLDNLAAVSDNLLLRFAALVHDIGKPKVKRFVEGIGWTFYGHELMGVRMLKTIAGRMKLPNEFYKYGQKLTRLHMRPIQLIGEEVSDSAVRRLLFHAGQEIDDLMALCKADITSGNPKLVKKHLENFTRVINRLRDVEEKDKLRAFQPPVRGDEIMAAFGLAPGPEVGRLKKLVEEAILEGLIPNEHDAALEFLRKKR